MSEHTGEQVRDLSWVRRAEIHPAIGFARLGNSPDEYFVGPEIPGVAPRPEDGRFKDAHGRIRRQAARFRCYGFDDTGTRHVELTGLTGQVSVDWGVHLVNRKAEALPFLGQGEVSPTRRNPEVTDRGTLVIDPGPRALRGPGQRAVFDTGTITFGTCTAPVTLGEIRTDAAGRLLVLGGAGLSGSPQGRPLEEAFNNPGWWDDTSDGWVQAIVTIAGRQITADQAWVVVTPPKYAPELDSPVSLFDRLWDLFGLADTNAIPSYTHDIAPILRRPVPMGAVSEPAAHHHGWPDPAYHFYLRRKIAAWLRNGPYDDDPMKMPQLSSMERADQQFVSLTATQLAHVKRWRRGQFRQDWTGPGTPVEGLSPTGLDRAALEACVGDSFSPGIEAGAFFVDLKNWAAPYGTFRFASTVSPGDVTANMALPWQADFKACGSNWWPVPRPNEVIPEADPDSPHQDWTRGWADDLDGMVEHWHELGFVQSDGQGRFRETDRRPGPPSTPPDLADGQHTTLPPHIGVPPEARDVDLAAFGHGHLTPGTTHTWPVQLTELDHGLDITVRTTDPETLALRVITPLGAHVAPDASPSRGRLHADRLELSLDLPVEVMPRRTARSGTWRIEVTAHNTDTDYQITVSTRSDIHLHDGHLAALPTHGAPGRIHLDHITLVDPDGATTAATDTKSLPVHPAGTRVRIEGISPRGLRFAREQFLPDSSTP